MNRRGRLSILLIEDNELDARAMTRYLRDDAETEFEITRVAELAAAMTLLEDHGFDCILADLSLPDSEGLVSVEVLSAEVPECPVVVLTGLDDPATAIEAVEQGAQDYLSKQSVEPGMIARSIRYAVARHNGDLALRSATEQLGLMRDRERIARDLHDTVIQQLFATGLGLQSLTGSVNDPTVKDRLAGAVAGIDAAIHQLRETIFGLHKVSERLALSQAIESLAEDKADGLGFVPMVEVGSVPEDLSPAVRHEAMQVVSEALANVAKHAEATAVVIAVDVDQDWLTLTVTDNGRGISANRMSGLESRSFEPRASESELNGRGVANMNQRAARLAGDFHIGPGPGGGTRIEWRVPLPQGISP